MTRRQYLEWEKFYEIDPWDGERDDLLAGIICSAVAASVQVDAAPKGFMPDWLGLDNRQRMPTIEEAKAKEDQVFARLKTMRESSGGDNRINGNSD